MHERRKEKESITINWSSPLSALSLSLSSFLEVVLQGRERDKANRKDPNDPPLLLPIAIQLMVSEDSTGAAGLILGGKRSAGRARGAGCHFVFFLSKGRDRGRGRSRRPDFFPLLSSLTTLARFFSF